MGFGVYLLSVAVLILGVLGIVIMGGGMDGWMGGRRSIELEMGGILVLVCRIRFRFRVRD